MSPEVTSLISALASPVGLGLFAYLIWRSQEKLTRRIDRLAEAMGKLAGRIDYAAGRLKDVTPAYGVTVKPPNGDDD